MPVGRSVGLVQQARRRRRGRRETRRISCRGAKLLTNKHRRNIGEREGEREEKRWPSRPESRKKRHVENRGIQAISNSSETQSPKSGAKKS